MEDLRIVASSHPSAKAPDHCKRKPRAADVKTAEELWRFHLKDETPGGSNHGNNANKKKIVTGVVFHISLHTQCIHIYILIVFFLHLFRIMIVISKWETGQGSRGNEMKGF